MFTNQWDAWMANKLCGSEDNASDGGIIIPSGISIKDTSGNQLSQVIKWRSGSTLYHPTRLDYGSVGSTGSLRFGTGTTSPTKTDYNLESLLDSSLVTYSTSSANTSIDTSGKIIVLYTSTIKNKSSSSISITEAALFKTVYETYASSSPTAKYIMIWREVFDAITIEPGATKTIEVTITFPNS